jgi:3-hydroxyisobutyrate dehydrogenase-like beta-hydroxyacid dehydrogenase
VAGRVGVVGLGRMGLALCGHLVLAGHEVWGHDVAPAAVEAARAVGVRPAGLPELAAGCPVVLVVVGSDEQVRDVVDELAGGLSSGSHVVVCSTVSPELMTVLAQGIGCGLVDAALVRGEVAAAEGTLAAYVGGAEPDVAAVRPVLACFATDVCHVGALGAGQVAKSLNNYLLWACICADDEALRLADAYGLDQSAVRRALSVGSGANRALATWDRPRTMPWAEHDMAILLAMARHSGLRLPGAEATADGISAVKRRRGLPAAD